MIVYYYYYYYHSILIKFDTFAFLYHDLRKKYRFGKRLLSAACSGNKICKPNICTRIYQPTVRCQKCASNQDALMTISLLCNYLPHPVHYWFFYGFLFVAMKKRFHLLLLCNTILKCRSIIVCWFMILFFKGSHFYSSSTQYLMKINVIATCTWQCWSQTAKARATMNIVAEIWANASATRWLTYPISTQHNIHITQTTFSFPRFILFLGTIVALTILKNIWIYSDHWQAVISSAVHLTKNIFLIFTHCCRLYSKKCIVANFLVQPEELSHGKN